MTSELERLKILEGKISQVAEYINKIVSENEKLRQQVKELKTEKKDYEEKAKKVDKIDQDLKKYEEEKNNIKERIETIINQIDKLDI